MPELSFDNGSLLPTTHRGAVARRLPRRNLVRAETATEPKGRRSLTQLLKQLVGIGIALTSERDLPALCGRIVSEARRLTDAEAGSLLLKERGALCFAVVQNDRLAARYGEAEMRRRLQAASLGIDAESLAGYVAAHGGAIIVADVYALAADAPYAFNAALDDLTDYHTQSALVAPLREPLGEVIGVLELLNARDESGDIIAFDPAYESLVCSLACQAAVAIRNARLEELSFKDPVTGVYTRRYFGLRVEEEAKRYTRFGEPFSLVLLGIDWLEPAGAWSGPDAGDDAMREVAGLLVKYSRSFAIVTRYGSDEFAVALVNTPKAAALAYAERIKRLIEQHPFRHALLTISIGVASLPEDVGTGEELIATADRARYGVTRLGRNAVEHV